MKITNYSFSLTSNIKGAAVAAFTRHGCAVGGFYIGSTVNTIVLSTLACHFFEWIIFKSFHVLSHFQFSFHVDKAMISYLTKTESNCQQLCGPLSGNKLCLNVQVC